jgi:Zn ribbon nucleic-acid-binding protein
MRWRQSFIAEVTQALQQLGLRACPICGSADTLGIGRFPTLLVEGCSPPDGDHLPVGEDDDTDVTLAVRVECAVCGHLMLFNAQKYRTEDERILERERAGEEGQPRE